MKISVAKYSGYCFGVERAVKKVYELLEKSKSSQDTNKNLQIYTLGKLIHNRHTIEEFKRNGVAVIDEQELGEVYAKCCAENPCIVITRAHGVKKATAEMLARMSEENEYFKAVDCTCPYVKKIHGIVSAQTDENTIVVIVGDPLHPEVEGIKSYCGCDSIVIRSPEEIAELEKIKSDYEKAVVVAQTTQDMSEWKICRENIKKVYTNALIFDTICSVTENRQSEVDEMSKKAELMIVIGDKDSSNSNKLFLLSKRNQPNTFFIEDSSELPDFSEIPHLTVGITAGASTPDSIIEEVIKIMCEENKELTPVLEEDTAQTNDAIGGKETNEAPESESFAEMLENSLKTLNTGETVKGIITSVSPNEIHVDLEAKVTGIIPFAELTDNPAMKIEDIYKVGEEIEAIVVKVSDLDGVATLSRKRIENVISWRKIVDAYNASEILTGKITESVKSGIIISLHGLRVFIPGSQSGLPRDADLSILVGTEQQVKIIDINEQRRRAVASIRVVKNEIRKAREEEFWANIEIGQRYEGVVKSLTSYGAFVDLGGVDGMVHSSELSWKRIKHPSEIMNVGETVSVYVKDFDMELKRISLGYKTEETNPWNIFIGKYKIGDVVEVKIVSMMPFGAFAEVVPGADGLIHISQIADRKIVQPSDVLSIGEEVKVKIVDIDTEKQKISLSIRELIGQDEELTYANDDDSDIQSDETDETDETNEYDESEEISEE